MICCVYSLLCSPQVVKSSNAFQVRDKQKTYKTTLKQKKHALRIQKTWDEEKKTVMRSKQEGYIARIINI